jgi:hypothetical protein
MKPFFLCFNRLTAAVRLPTPHLWLAACQHAASKDAIAHRERLGWHCLGLTMLTCTRSRPLVSLSSDALLAVCGAEHLRQQGHGLHLQTTNQSS